MSVKVERKSQYHPEETDVKTGVLFELPTGVHEVVNVDAVGDCGYLSLLEDPIFELWTVKKLRSLVTSLETPLFVDTANNLLGTHSGALALERWRTDQRKAREWMDDVVMLAVLLVFNVNLIIWSGDKDQPESQLLKFTNAMRSYGLVVKSELGEYLKIVDSDPYQINLFHQSGSHFIYLRPLASSSNSAA